MTLSGAPGVGKTRLALELLMQRVRAGRDGLFVDLADAADVPAMIHMVARAAGTAAHDDADTTDAVVLVGAALAARGQLLLVLDNVDATADVARGLVAELLVLAPELVVLVTSRSRLSLAIERVHEVRSLSTATRDGAPSPAMELFIERARDASGAEVDAKGMDDVRAIVETLDGLPLAIELAAARTSLLSGRVARAAGGAACAPRRPIRIPALVDR